MGLAPVGQQHQEDDDEQEAPARRDAQDGGQRQQAVRPDVDGARGDVEPAHLDLGNKEHEAGTVYSTVIRVGGEADPEQAPFTAPS